MKKRLPGLALLLLSAACGGSPSPAPAPVPSPASSPAGAPAASAAPTAPATPKVWRAEKDGLVTLPKGATFPVATGWQITEHADRVTVEDPEKELRLTYLEIDAARAELAITEAWKRHDPSFSLPARATTSPPSTTWDEVVQTSYETPSSRVVLANARRRDGTVWVAILDTTAGALDRRGAQMQNSFERLVVPGLAQESFAGKVAAPLDEAKRKALLAFAEEARAALNVPGMSMAVVQEGKVVLEAGLGVRELGKRDPVTPRTLFLIGSTTKSLSTLLMARAVDEGKFGWDTPVRTVDPTFALGDPALSAALSMQHLVCACTGVPRHDMELLFSFAGKKPEDLLGKLGELKPTTKLGETFQYNNQLVAVGGFLAGRAFHPKLPLGEAYDRAMREKVLVPLGMTDSTFSLLEGQRRAASSHDDDVRGDLKVLPWSMEQFVVPLRPSGGLLSHAGDMAKYLQAELAKGKSVTGVQVASEANVVRRRLPQMKINDDAAYRLGLVSGKVKGVPFVEHGGGTFGQRSTFFYLPDQRVGLIVLANGPGPLGSLIKTRLLELWFDAKPAAASGLAFQVAEKAKSIARFQEKLAEAEPAAVVGGLVGRYRHPSLGELVVTESKGELTFDVGEWKSRVAWQKRSDGKKDLVLLDPPLGGLPFEVREEGGKPALHLAFGQHGYTFKR